MRFHVTRNDEGLPVDFVVRVYPSEKRGTYNGPSGCQCPRVHQVVMKSVRIEQVRQGAQRDGRKFVCGCHGEVVS